MWYLYDSENLNWAAQNSPGPHAGRDIIIASTKGKQLFRKVGDAK